MGARRRRAGAVAVAVLSAAALLAAGYFAVGAFGRGGADTPTIVIDTSIGGVALGMSTEDVVAQYGKPESTLAIAVPGGGAGLLARYAVHGGLLLVTYADGQVVQISTTSVFYRTSGGIGPGAPVAALDGITGFGEDFCSLGVWNGGSAAGPDGAFTSFAENGDVIGTVTIGLLRFYDVCEGAGENGEVSEPSPAPPTTFTLSVSVDTPGSGWVRSSPYKIDCPLECERPFDAGTTVTLDAHPTGGFTFDGWSGACIGTAPCVLTIDGARQVVAHFSGMYVPLPGTTTATTTTTAGTTTAGTTTATTSTATTTTTIDE